MQKNVHYGLAEAAAPMAPLRTQPHNLAAEQSLLGAILVNNETYHRVSGFLIADHFFEPVHQRIFAACEQRIQSGQLADYNSLFHHFNEDEALKELNGAEYLSKLTYAAETIFNAAQYGQVIHDLALKRGLIELGEDVVNTAFDPQTDLPASRQIEDAEQRLFALGQLGEIKGGFRDFSAILSNTIDMVESAYHKEGEITGVPTGLVGLDMKLGGLQPSDLLILAARPSMGKTALAVSIAANAASQKPAGSEAKKSAKHENYVVGIFSLEMSAEQLAMRLLSSEARISSDELRRGQLRDDDEWHRVVAASQTLASRAIFIDDTPALTVAALRSRARRLMRTEGLSLLVVDYLQLMRGSGTNAQANRVQEISEITQGLKAIAKELQIPVMALSQLSRAVEQREDKRPLLSDLRDSGSIEQDADVVMFIYREEYYLTRSAPQQRDGESMEKFQQRQQTWMERCERAHNKSDVIVAKQRNGPIGTTQLQFDPQFGEFRNLELAEHPSEGY